METTRTYYVSTDGDLCCYQTGEALRRATAGEERASREAARIDGGAGVIGHDDLHAQVRPRSPIVAVGDVVEYIDQHGQRREGTVTGESTEHDGALVVDGDYPYAPEELTIIERAY